MRDIKFRAWSISDGVMEDIYDLYWFEESGVHNITDGKADGHHSNYNIMQFTGLYDNNAKEIYEGDILDQSKYPEDDPCPYGVIFDDGAFRKQYCEWDETLPKPVLNQREFDLLDDVIIGNIHENPELLESQS